LVLVRSSHLLLAFLASLGAVAQATPELPREACLVRDDPAPTASGGTATQPPVLQSHLGWREKTTRLYDIELTLRQGLASCSIAGTARLNSTPEGDSLVLPVRPVAGLAHGATPCLVTIRIAPATATISSSEASCRAQDLCGGRVELQGQRFEWPAATPPSATGPCFARPQP
jgi:hypothetical protein